MPTIGYLSVGVSSFALLAAGPRLLGTADYSQLAIAWTMATIFASGLAVPAEQTVIRNWSSGGASATSLRAGIWLTLACIPLVLGLLNSWIGVEVFGLSLPLWWFAALVSCGAWVPLIAARGRLAGPGRFQSYGITIVAEGLARLALVTAAILMPDSWAVRQWMLAMAIGVPLLVSAAVGLLLHNRRPLPIPTTTREGKADGLLPITLTALAMQVLLNAAPLWLGSQAEVPPATAGLFVSAATYMRIPILVTGGSIAVVLSQTSAALVTGRVERLRTLVRHYLVSMGGLSCALALVLVLAAPIGLAVMYGPHSNVGTVSLAVLGCSTVLFVVGNVATQALVGMRRPVAAAVCWGAAASISLLCLVTLPASLLNAALALMVGSLAGCLAILITWRRTFDLASCAGTS